MNDKDQILLEEAYLQIVRRSFLEEGVSGDYLFHTSSTDVIQSILEKGLKSNSMNQDRTGSNLKSISFSRNWRYVFTIKDDDGQGVSGLDSSGFAFVFDKSIMSRRLKMSPVTNIDLSKLRVFQNKTKQEMDQTDAMELIKSFDGIIDSSGEPHKFPELMSNPLIEPLTKIKTSIGLPLLAGDWAKAIASGIIRFYKNSTKSDEDFRLYKQRINVLIKAVTQKRSAKLGQSSESEEVVLTNKDFVPLKELGFVGYIFAPKREKDPGMTVVSDENKLKIREMMDRYGAKDLTGQIVGKAWS